MNLSDDHKSDIWIKSPSHGTRQSCHLDINHHHHHHHQQK